MKRKTASLNRQDILRRFAGLVRGPAEGGEDYVKLPTKLALDVLDLAKRAGRRPLYDLPLLNDILTEEWILQRAEEIQRVKDERRGVEHLGRLPIKQAEAELFEERYAGRRDKLDDPKAFDSFRQTLRRKRRAARNGIQALIDIDPSEIRLPPEGKSLREIDKPLHELLRH